MHSKNANSKTSWHVQVKRTYNVQVQNGWEHKNKQAGKHGGQWVGTCHSPCPLQVLGAAVSFSSPSLLLLELLTRPPHAGVCEAAGACTHHAPLVMHTQNGEGLLTLVVRTAHLCTAHMQA